MAIRALPNELSLAQIQKAIQALDVNRDNRLQSAEIGFPPSQLTQLNGGAATDGVELSRAAQTLFAGTARVSFSGNYRAARDAAQSLDANGNGTIDAGEIALSEGLKQEISAGKPVTVADLADAFWRGTVTLGRSLKLV
jgi:hypothetical protein